ncbi:MAG: hypothetical protein Q4A31_04775 [Corynebacterium sp.]|uniref:hypothetical protein n=1 Tax=Corynebacterium sp. TaxID=1720 RepID=UPI0026DAAF15|nr:hypothetical protein [Corynebacterium sp.]MDO4761211.1 hypothetical protein [Corynebacterium sp.]
MKKAVGLSGLVLVSSVAFSGLSFVDTISPVLAFAQDPIAASRVSSVSTTKTAAPKSHAGTGFPAGLAASKKPGAEKWFPAYQTHLKIYKVRKAIADAAISFSQEEAPATWDGRKHAEAAASASAARAAIAVLAAEDATGYNTSVKARNLDLDRVGVDPKVTNDALSVLNKAKATYEKLQDKGTSVEKKNRREFVQLLTYAVKGLSAAKKQSVYDVDAFSTFDWGIGQHPWLKQSLMDAQITEQDLQTVPILELEFQKDGKQALAIDPVELYENTIATKAALKREFGAHDLVDAQMIDLSRSLNNAKDALAKSDALLNEDLETQISAKNLLEQRRILVELRAERSSLEKQKERFDALRTSKNQDELNLAMARAENLAKSASQLRDQVARAERQVPSESMIVEVARPAETSIANTTAVVEESERALVSKDPVRTEHLQRDLEQIKSEVISEEQEVAELKETGAVVELDEKIEDLAPLAERAAALFEEIEKVEPAAAETVDIDASKRSLESKLAGVEDSVEKLAEHEDEEQRDRASTLRLKIAELKSKIAAATTPEEIAALDSQISGLDVSVDEAPSAFQVEPLTTPRTDDSAGIVGIVMGVFAGMVGLWGVGSLVSQYVIPFLAKFGLKYKP